MPIEGPYYPIIYIRGYAGSKGAIEETVATPYMGFNQGSTKQRLTYRGEIQRNIFESPLLRLMKDEKYQDTFANGSENFEQGEVSPRSVWIFRYYEEDSRDLGAGRRRSIPDYAEDLRKFILQVRDAVCGQNQTDKRAFKVHLVAHSMGGLIARCYLQNLCVHGPLPRQPERESKKAYDERVPALELPGDHLVDKVFTYATPHNGIEMFGFNVPALWEWIDSNDKANFNRDVIWDYLRLGFKAGEKKDKKRPKNADVRSLNGAFSPERFFCLVGTSYEDYDAALGFSRKTTGARSDGLVMMDNAWVKDAPRAYVHRTHGGQFGIVNSEEGYQNLRRFLFGHMSIKVELRIDQVKLPQNVESALKKHNKRVKALYRVESGVCVRGANYWLHERRRAQDSELVRRDEEFGTKSDDDRMFLFSGYLHKGCVSPERPNSIIEGDDESDRYLCFAVDCLVEMPEIEIDGQLRTKETFFSQALLNEQVLFDVALNPLGVRYRMRGQNKQAAKVLNAAHITGNGVHIYEVALDPQKKRDAPDAYVSASLIVSGQAWK